MTAEEIFEKLKEKFGEEDIKELTAEGTSDPFITVNPQKIRSICLFLRDDEDLLFDYMILLSGMDYGENFGVVYHLFSMKYKHIVVIKVFLDKEEPILPTVERVWKTANWHEREAWDMYGIKFEGHPNLIRILTPYDWEGHPLRKDYKVQEEYHGIRVPY